jgi:predicted ATP-binding protein involved in virulence
VSFQKDVLPAILRRFPKVQFLFSTHSPFLLLGMANTGNIDVYALPTGNRIVLEDFSEFQAGYDVFVQMNEQYRSRYQQLQEEVAKSNRPLVS